MCMLGIVAGIVFLLGAVGVVVICWRLDRVQKAVRGKFTEDAQDLSAPLSDYVDRAVLPDTLHLNFDMITLLNNQENKLAVTLTLIRRPALITHVCISRLSCKGERIAICAFSSAPGLRYSDMPSRVSIYITS